MHGARNGPSGNRHRVACRRVRYKHGMQAAQWGIGTGSGMGCADGATKKGSQGPHIVPKTKKNKHKGAG